MNFHLIFTVVTILHTTRAQSFVNDYDGNLNFKCPTGQYVSKIESKNSDGAEDRRWKYVCREGFVDVDECKLSEYANELDGPMNFECPNQGVVVGANSIHNNDYEDRRWRFECCKATTARGICDWKFMNNYDQQMSFEVDPGRTISGFQSTHNNDKEDREWKAYQCKYATCQAKKMRILSKVDPTLEEVRIVGITSSQGCSKDGTYTTSLESTDSVTETSSFTASKGKSFTFSTSMSVGMSGGVPGIAEISVGLEQTFGGSTEWSSSETKETSTETSSSAGQSLEYKGPGAALVMGYVQSYKFDNKDVDVEYDIECDDGKKFTEKATASFKLTRFSQTHFVQKHGTFNSPQDCSQQSNECIQSVNGKKALEPSEVDKEFDNCFEGKGKTDQSQEFSVINGTAINASTVQKSPTNFTFAVLAVISVIISIFI